MCLESLTVLISNWSIRTVSPLCASPRLFHLEHSGSFLTSNLTAGYFIRVLAANAFTTLIDNKHLCLDARCITVSDPTSSKFAVIG
jgi:hypothetical protein